MKCPICGKDVELQNKQVGTDPNGTPIFHEYAVCRDCKKQWDLDKHRAKKRAAKADVTPEKNTARSEAPAKKTIEKSDTPVKKSIETADAPSKKPLKKADAPVKKAVAKSDVPAKKPSSVKKNAPVKKESVSSNTETAKADTETGQYYGNIPPEHIRAKRERAVRQSYEEMLATDPNYKPRKKKNESDELPSQKRAANPESVSEDTKKRPEPEKKRPVTKPEYEEEDDFDEDDDYIYYIPAKYRIIRVILGILSILGFGYFAYRGFLAGLDSIASGGQSSSGMTYILLAVCMLVSGLLLLILQNKRSVAAYIAPIVFYIAGAVFAFLKREGDSILLYSAIVSAVLAVILVILCATSRNQEDDDDYEYDEDENEDEDFDDEEFDDEFDDED